MNDSYNRDVEVFTEAIRLPRAERAAYLERVCGSEAALRRRVEALLEVSERMGDFLEESPRTGSIPARSGVSVGAQPGDRIGNYKLLQQIGEGGCGVVFMADQEKPVHRRVALKIIKPGMDTKNVIARFEAEGQALALMDHPNIAKVFDAGATDSGRPYFVMELISGIKITEYCNQHLLATRERLELFVQVCEAVQHAHQKGIIHRDLKPSNILVTRTEQGGASPVIIDFGIAKATNQRLTDKTLFTAFEMLIGTPAYMSPEQALASVDIDTRSDIYSLGVLLYELLTGSTPFDTGDLLKAGLEEVRRVIREQEPIRPSTRLGAMVAADLVNVSKHYGAEAPKLIRQVRGDLDWIVMKALEKERVRRYATASGMAMDINRHLTGEAVLARPPSRIYKARKLLARNKLSASSLAAIFILLVAGLVVTTRLLIVERHTREQAEHREEVYRLEGLGTAQWIQGNLAGAVSSFRGAFLMRSQFLGDQPPNALVAALFVDALERIGRAGEANAFLIAELPRVDSQSMPAYTRVFGKFEKYLAEKGQWQEAANGMSSVIKYDPDSPDSYHTLIPLLVACGDVSGYRRFCRQIIPCCGGTQDPATADQMAKDCLILPSSGADLKAVGALADLAVTRGTNSSSFSFFEDCKALAEYRQGHFAGAIEWAHSATNDPFPYSKAEGCAILSMGRFRLAQTNQALAALSDCTKVIDEEFPKLSSGNLGNDWRDWIIAHALRDEAKGLIQGNNNSAGSLPPK